MEWRWVEAARCGREGINLQGENHVSAISVSVGGPGRAGCGNSFSSDGGRAKGEGRGKQEAKGKKGRHVTDLVSPSHRRAPRLCKFHDPPLRTPRRLFPPFFLPPDNPPPTHTHLAPPGLPLCPAQHNPPTTHSISPFPSLLPGSLPAPPSLLCQGINYFGPAGGERY